VPDKAGTDGGLLVGQTIADLPLEGMRLAVLSACETGLGGPDYNEAVSNLQLAFHVAGCPDVVASLWQGQRPRHRCTHGQVLTMSYGQGPTAAGSAAAGATLGVPTSRLGSRSLGGDDRGPPKVNAKRHREVLEQGVLAPLAKGIGGQLPDTDADETVGPRFVLSGTGQ